MKINFKKGIILVINLCVGLDLYSSYRPVTATSQIKRLASVGNVVSLTSPESAGYAARLASGFSFRRMTPTQIDRTRTALHDIVKTFKDKMKPVLEDATEAQRKNIETLVNLVETVDTEIDKSATEAYEQKMEPARVVPSEQPETVKTENIEKEDEGVVFNKLYSRESDPEDKANREEIDRQESLRAKLLPVSEDPNLLIPRADTRTHFETVGFVPKMSSHGTEYIDPQRALVTRPKPKARFYDKATVDSIMHRSAYQDRLNALQHVGAEFRDVYNPFFAHHPIGKAVVTDDTPSYRE